MTTRVSTRLWEIDALRGVAVVLMIFFHFMWDLQFFQLTTVNVFSLPWQVFARGIGTMFTFLLGLSLILDRARTVDTTPWRRVLWRGGQIFGCGMIITVATYAAFGEQYVRFGILHLLGASIVLGQPFLRLRPLVTMSLGVLLLSIGFYLNLQLAPTPWFSWLGWPPAGFVTVDYYPLLPWFGMALLGIATGLTLYPAGVRCFALPDLGALPPVRALRFLGRHSLAIYLLHQPVLLGLLLAFDTLMP